MGELNERLIAELIDAVRAQLRKEQSDRLRDVYLIGDIEKDPARVCIERLRELASDNNRPITLYINSAGGTLLTDSPSTTASATSSAAESRSRPSCKGWPTRWDRSFCRRAATENAWRFPTRGS